MGQNDFYVGYFYDTNYLAHHGILGMHWGKRNGPPYPLDAKSHSASEKKAGWRKSLDAGKAAEAVKKHTVHNFTKANRQNYSSEATKKYEKKYGKDSRQYQNSKEFDKKISKKYADDNTKLGKKFVKNLIMTPSMLQTYNTSRAANEGRGKAFVRSVLDINVGVIAGGMLWLPTAGIGRVLSLSDQVEKSLNNTGTELSLQQRAIRRKYIKKAAPKKLVAQEGVSKTTQNAIKAYNSMSDDEFRKKFAVDKNTYAKRVEKYGDPYMNSPLAKVGKKLQENNRKEAAKLEYKAEKKRIQDRYDRGLEAIEDKYKKFENLSPEDVRREEQLEKEYNEAWDAAKKRYEQARRR